MLIQATTNPITRRKHDGSQDRICLSCLATIASSMVESGTQKEEDKHVCSPVRLILAPTPLPFPFLLTTTKAIC